MFGGNGSIGINMLVPHLNLESAKLHRGKIARRAQTEINRSN
jgi:hypothetical protein